MPILLTMLRGVDRLHSLTVELPRCRPPSLCTSLCKKKASVQLIIEERSNAGYECADSF